MNKSALTFLQKGSVKYKVTEQSSHILEPNQIFKISTVWIFGDNFHWNRRVNHYLKPFIFERSWTSPIIGTPVETYYVLSHSLSCIIEHETSQQAELPWSISNNEVRGLLLTRLMGFCHPLLSLKRFNLPGGIPSQVLRNKTNHSQNKPVNKWLFNKPCLFSSIQWVKSVLVNGVLAESWPQAQDREEARGRGDEGERVSCKNK